MSGPDLRIAELPFLTQIGLRVEPGSDTAAAMALALGVPLPTEPGTSTSTGGDAPPSGTPASTGAAMPPSGTPTSTGDVPSSAVSASTGADVSPSVTPASGRQVLWLGPDEWLVVGPPGDTGLEDRLRAAAGTGHAAVTDVSAQRTVLLVTGPKARDLLSHGCALDLHPRAFGPGRCAQTMLARAQVLLAAREDGGFHIFVRSSFAEYLAAWLLDAAGEYLGG
ncbi:sarcosine oxidase subunit gamma family protein [Streptosporangium sp. NPDC002524]|uniref:sarcosine oxidase subunit gamma n=1 Tax=Streptosporangium sp. NPDC002524 TaxID=3154537 RepID=UPI003325C443